MKEEEEKVRRVNPFNGWDVCRRNSFLGVKSWLMVEGEGRGGGHEDLAAGYHSNFIIVSNYAKSKQLDSLLLAYSVPGGETTAFSLSCSFCSFPPKFQ